jgi:hypothetical protein
VTQPPRSAPGAIIAAIGLLGLLALLVALQAVNTLANQNAEDTPPWLAGAYFLVAAAFGYAAVGTWLRQYAAMGIAIVFGLVLILAGLYVATVPDLAIRLLDYDKLGLLVAALGAAVIGLVIVPRASREWYAS